MSNLAKVIKYKIFVRLFCLLGCVYQIYDMSKIYFSYRTSTNVKYKTNSRIELPGITICYNKLDQLINGQLKSKLNRKSHDFGQSALDDMNKLSIKQQLSEFELYPVKLNKCEVLKNYQDYMPCSEITNLTTSFDKNFFCFSIFGQLSGQSDENFTIRETDISFPQMVKIEVKQDNNHQGYQNKVFMLSLHDRKVKNYLLYHKRILMIDNQSADYGFVNYHKIVVKYLFNPLTKPCFERRTHEMCLTECKIDEFVEKMNKYPFYYAILDHDHDNLNISTEKEFVNFQWSGRCERMCDHNTECLKEYFVLESKEYKINDKEKNFHLAINFPTHPTTIYEISLKMSFEEYLCLIASILSLWFGFNVVMVTNLCPMFVFKIKRYFNSKRKLNVQVHNVNLNLKVVQPRFNNWTLHK